MLVSEAITLLQTSELKQLKVKDDDTAILGYLNLGILELHKRFLLWQAEAIITLELGTTVYTLDGVDANVTIDLSDHDFLMVDEAYEETGERLTINDEKDPYGITTPRWNQVEIGEEEDGLSLSIIYRASPKFMTTVDDVIQLPSQFFEALFLYCGFKGHASVRGDEKTENNTHYKRFEASCGRINFHGLFNQDSLNSVKFEDRGFV